MPGQQLLHAAGPAAMLTAAVLALAGVLASDGPLLSLSTLLGLLSAACLAGASGVFQTCFAANEARRLAAQRRAVRERERLAHQAARSAHGRRGAPLPEALTWDQVARGDDEEELEESPVDTGLLWQAGWALLVLGGLFGVARNGDSAVVVVLAALLAVAHAAAPESAWAGRALLRGAAWGAMVLVGVASQEGNVLQWGIVALPVAAHGVGASLLGASRTPGLPPNVGFFALLHSGSSLVLFLSLGAWQARQGLPFYYITALPFLGLFFLQTLLPTIRAVAEPRRIYVRAAVLEAEVGVVLLAAALPAGLQGVVSALLVALFYFPVRSLLRSPAPPV